MSVEVVIKNSCSSVGEGPHWDDATQRLLYVDIVTGDVHRWDPATGQDEKLEFGKNLSLVVPCKKGGYVISLDRSLCRLDWDSKTVTVLKEVEEGKDTRFNDGKCDASGRLWAGTMGNEKIPAQPELYQGSLYSLEVDGTLRTHKTGVSISNGLAWTQDNKTMYYIDSIPRKVFAYDFDLATGTMSNERAVIDFGGEETMKTKGYPDGMTIDNEGKLWVACFIVGKVIRFDPETGKELQTLQFPAMRPTSCCFGGKNLDELYVTCSNYKLTEEEVEKTPLAGSVFRVTGLGVKGYPANVYEG